MTRRERRALYREARRLTRQPGGLHRYFVREHVKSSFGPIPDQVLTYEVPPPMADTFCADEPLPGGVKVLTGTVMGYLTKGAVI